MKNEHSHTCPECKKPRVCEGVFCCSPYFLYQRCTSCIELALSLKGSHAWRSGMGRDRVTRVTHGKVEVEYVSPHTRKINTKTL